MLWIALRCEFYAIHTSSDVDRILRWLWHCCPKQHIKEVTLLCFIPYRVKS